MSNWRNILSWEEFEDTHPIGRRVRLNMEWQVLYDLIQENLLEMNIRNNAYMEDTEQITHLTNQAMVATGEVLERWEAENAIAFDDPNLNWVLGNSYFQYHELIPI